MTVEFSDVACTACGCVCDDLRVTVDGNRITRFAPDCPIAERKLLQPFPVEPVATLRGRPVPLEEAIAAAAQMLREAHAPLVYGLSSSSTEGQRSAVHLADAIGATIDTSASTCHGPSILALQEFGEPTCSLGEIAERADLVVYWGSDPAVSHPRHMERYALEPRGRLTPGGREGRTLVVVDTIRTRTSDAADLFLQVEPAADFDVLWVLRGLMQGIAPPGPSIGGIAQEALVEFAERLRGCRCGVFFFGRGLTRGPTGHKHVAALLQLARDLNAHTRFHVRRMRVYGDVAGADTVLCWQTGFPFSVSLSRGYPRYNPGEFSAEGLLTRGEIDGCLLVGTEGLESLSSAARTALADLPTILIDGAAGTPGFEPHVHIATATYGIHRPGTAYRMDEIPIPLRSLLDSSLPSDAEVLDRIRRLCGEA